MCIAANITKKTILMRRYTDVRDAVKKKMTKAVRYILRGKI